MLKQGGSIRRRTFLVHKVVFTDEARKQIAKLDQQRKIQIKEAVEKIAANPDSGKPLTNLLKGRFSFRVGDYRIIYKVFKHEVLVLILTIGHRREVYKKTSRKNY